MLARFDFLLEPELIGREMPRTRGRLGFRLGVSVELAEPAMFSEDDELSSSSSAWTSATLFTWIDLGLERSLSVISIVSLVELADLALRRMGCWESEEESRSFRDCGKEREISPPNISKI